MKHKSRVSYTGIMEPCQGSEMGPTPITRSKNTPFFNPKLSHFGPPFGGLTFCGYSDIMYV